MAHCCVSGAADGKSWPGAADGRSWPGAADGKSCPGATCRLLRAKKRGWASLRRGRGMATIVEGLTAAQCWTCDRFYGLFFGETVSLEMGNRIPKLRPPLGNPDTEERAWWLASDRLGVVYEETLAYAEAAESGMAFKPSKPVIEKVLEQGAGMVDAPIHVMVPNKASRLSAADLTCCLSSTAPAEGSFVRGPGGGLLIAGPNWRCSNWPSSFRCRSSPS